MGEHVLGVPLCSGVIPQSDGGQAMGYAGLVDEVQHVAPELRQVSMGDCSWTGSGNCREGRHRCANGQGLYSRTDSSLYGRLDVWTPVWVSVCALALEYTHLTAR